MKDQTEEALRAWWKERRESADIDLLRQRIMRSVEDDHYEEAVPAVRSSVALWSPRFGYALAGAAAMAICLLAARWAGWPTTGAEKPLAEMAWVQDGELAAGARVFGEAARLFDKRLRWLSESDGAIDMGIDSCETGDVEEARPFFVRVVVLTRARGQEKWAQSWKTDVIARPEEWVEVVTNGGSKSSLMLWVYPLENGHLLVDTDMRMSGERELTLRESTVMSTGKPVVVSSGQHGNTEYRVLQTIETLPLPGSIG